jgi:ribosome biogenesis SPOUT family RNA methylase Rps3
VRAGAGCPRLDPQAPGRTPDDHALWCQPDADTRIGDPRMRGDEALRTGNLIGEGNALIDFNEYNNVDSSMGEAQREVVDRIR